MNCLLTGGTGIVGSHIIFEWLHKAIVEKTVNHLFLVIRDNEKSAEDRLLAILKDASRPEFLNNFTLEACLEKITVISHDLDTINKAVLDNYSFNTVIHCAGSTSLLHTTDSKEKVHTQNYLVTKNLLEELPTSVNRFLYIRLIDLPFFETPKFDVFYSWAMFLDKYATKSKDKFRIWIDKESGLNIVPVDFVSKAILYAFLNPTIKELNIVNPKQILHKNYVGDVLESFKISSYEYVSEKPEDLKLDITLGVHDNFMNLIDFSVEKKFRKSY